ncbi:MAG TPA: M20/M25/M40 family metallo-hydrolase [Chitinophagaceae bacterium]|nr:M20/M25/M40 family metallo-hydrolase [Chitinophagaceae bacterium]
MNSIRGVFLFISFFLVQISFAQKKKSSKLSKADNTTVTNLQAHISYLANDKLEGRRAGTNGEKLAGEYISQKFQETGLQPKGSDGFFQPFEIYDGKQINSATHFIINENNLAIEKDFFPFPFSQNISIEAVPSIAVQEADMPWFYDMKETLEENKNNPHFDLNEYIRNNAKKAKSRGATAVVLYNTSSIDDKLKFDSKDRTEKLDVPVIYVLKDAAKKYFSDQSASLDIKMKIDIGDKKRIGRNVIGFLDNGAAKTVVLGAHYDHLGYGEDGNSMLRTGEKAIHNGADDNASGTAALIELARILKNTKQKNNNYLFIAFSAEELGLNGSKFFTEHPTIDFSKVNYMINMDMVGRLNDSSQVVTIGGYGTSPQWSSLINPNNKKNPFVIRIDSSGTGPSDHTSFYRKDVPVLFFFTGLHSDYHKPTDDFDKINYAGETKIINYISGIVLSPVTVDQKLAFTKTRETQSTSSMRSGGVTMGIMPDYTFAGAGIRCDGVTDGRPAQKAGLKAGDIIIKVGDYTVSSMESYMQTLGKFQKGEKAKVKFKRGNEEMETEVQF